MNTEPTAVAAREALWDIVNKWRTNRRLLDQAYLTTQDCGALVDDLLIALDTAIATERERCAKFVEDGANGTAGRDTRYDIASAIREGKPQ